MATKKRYFTRNKKKIGKKSGKLREKEILEAKVLEQKPEIVPIPTVSQRKSPKNNRSITDTLKKVFPLPKEGMTWQTWAVLSCFLVLFVLSIWQGIVLVEQGITLRRVLAKRQQLFSDMQLWENIGNQYPTYRDAYFQVAVLAYQLGDNAKARQYVQKVLVLDPNNILAEKLGKLLN